MTTAEDRDQWERDEEALRAHASAQISTHSPDEGSRVVPDPARVARYAEAIRSCVIANPEQMRDLTEAVVAVADGERAALVELVREMGREAVAEAEAYRAVLARAEAAEAALATVRVQVKAVVARMASRKIDHRHADEIGHMGVQGRAYFYAGDIYDDYCALRTVLADAPAERPDLDRPCACGHLLTDHLDGLACYAGTTVTSEFACDCGEWQPDAPAEQRAGGGA